MTQYIFANNVNTSLFSAITSTATSLTLLSATNLPTLAAGQVMPLTLNDKATRTVFEIVYVTAISGTTLTVTRGQEGTAAQNWQAGDYAFSTQTAQATELAIQSGAYNYAVDTGTTANAYVVSLTPAIPATIPDGFSLTMYVTPARVNNGAVTLNGVAMVDRNGNPILGGQIKGMCAVEYSTAYGKWMFTGAKQYISVMDFGAKGDGVTDDTASIQAALNSAPIGSTVLLTGNTFYVATGLTLPYGISFVGLDGATILGPTTGTQTLVTLSGVNNGVSKPFYTSRIRGIKFRIRSNYSGLIITNSSFAAETIEEGIIVDSCHFTSYDYTTAATVPLVSITLVIGARFINCTFQSYTANTNNGIANGILISGSANSTFVACNFTYLATAITLQSSGTQVSQGISFLGCITNGCISAVVSSGTFDVLFSGCLLDNNTGQSITSADDMAITFDGCYIGSSYLAGPMIAFSANSAQTYGKIYGSQIVEYASANAGVSMITIAGTSTNSYYGLLISDSNFRGANNVDKLLSANYSEYCIISNCAVVGALPKTAPPIVFSNASSTVESVKVVNLIGITPQAVLGGPTSLWAAPTALSTVGSGVSYQNPYPFDVMVYLTGGTVTNITIIYGGNSATLSGGPLPCVTLPAGAELNITFSAAPTWIWCGL